MVDKYLSAFVNSTWNKIEKIINNSDNEIKLTESQLFPASFRNEFLVLARLHASGALQNVSLSKRENKELTLKIEESLVNSNSCYSVRIKPIVRVSNILEDFYSNLSDFVIYKIFEYMHMPFVYCESPTIIVKQKDTTKESEPYDRKAEIYNTIRGFKVSFTNFSEKDIVDIKHYLKDFLKEAIMQFIQKFFESKDFQEIKFGLYDSFNEEFIKSFTVKTKILKDSVQNQEFFVGLNSLKDKKQKFHNLQYGSGYYTEYSILSSLAKEFHKLPNSFFEVCSETKVLYNKETSELLRDWGSYGKREVIALVRIYKKTKNKNLLVEIEDILDKAL